MEFARGRQPGGSSLSSAHLSAGAAWRDPWISGSGVDVGTIAFQPGAYIRWHSHRDGQFLLIDHGSGVIVTRAGEVRNLQPADIVYSPPGEEHWHGSAPDAYLGQVNISMGPTTWLEEVTPQEYRAAIERASRS